MSMTYAPLIRVSTERQEKRGESLRTQKADLLKDVETMGGTIHHWYEGQEHATPAHERKILDDLINAAKRKEFDAVIIWSIDRWSRDNLRSAQDLEILKDNGIRFFVRTKEYNLFCMDDYFMITLYVLIGRKQASEQSRRSDINKRNRAKQGYPSCGRLPFGRSFDKKTAKWSIVPEAQRKVQEMAELYLKNDYNFLEIGKKFDMNASYVHKILNSRCGKKWDQFKGEIPTDIPPLLPENIINAITVVSG
jgi:site-specific DNA recombinase